MLTMLLLILLVVLLFGGLGIFVAKAFLLGLLIVLAIALIGGITGTHHHHPV